MEFGRFRAHETIRRDDEGGTVRSKQLQMIVPSGCGDAYDLITHVGLRSYLHADRLDEIRESIHAQSRLKQKLPDSSLFDLQHRFLYHLGFLQRQAAPVLREFIASGGGACWAMDGTVEVSSPVHYGIQEARSGIMLGCWKSSSETKDKITGFIRELIALYGAPDDVICDLGAGLNAVQDMEELAHTNIAVCRLHLLADVGEDIYTEPEKLLRKRITDLKLRSTMRQQRTDQNRKLRQDLANGKAPAHPLLPRLLNGEAIDDAHAAWASCELLGACHDWILDYAADGSNGHPFDPHLLYFHRRALTMQKIISGVLKDPTLKADCPQPLRNFSERLKRYVHDPAVQQAASHYEAAAEAFTRFRSILRLGAARSSSVDQICDISPEAEAQIQKDLTQWRQDLQTELDNRPDSDPQRRIYDILATHWDRYEAHLRLPLPRSLSGKAVRTIQSLETWWWDAKRTRRETNGRKNITRDLVSLPPEFMLAANLRNEHFIKTVLGTMDRLPAKLADATREHASSAPAFSVWRKLHKSQPLGRQPRSRLREPTFLEKLSDTLRSFLTP